MLRDKQKGDIRANADSAAQNQTPHPRGGAQADLELYCPHKFKYISYFYFESIFLYLQSIEKTPRFTGKAQETTVLSFLYIQLRH